MLNCILNLPENNTEALGVAKKAQVPLGPPNRYIFYSAAVELFSVY